MYAITYKYIDKLIDHSCIRRGYRIVGEYDNVKSEIERLRGKYGAVYFCADVYEISKQLNEFTIV